MKEDSPPSLLEGLPESKFKRIIILSTGIFLIFLMLSYLVFSSGAYDFIAGFFESSPIENEQLIFKSGTIIFENSSYEKILEGFSKNNELEFKLCFIGEKEGSWYVIKDILAPEIIDQSYRSVSARECPKGTLVVAHSHPFKRCIASFQDILNHRWFKKTNPGALMAVMCDKGRFNIYQ